ncbi:MAG: hypothetical protein J5I93_10210 [Pirellulaceae bacterium]|nr:hypothetical protein [Pirellulaceae bacterium]
MLAADARLLEYDLAGNVASIRDGRGQETRYEFDDLGQLVQVQAEGPGGSASYAYDAHGNLVQMADPAGHSFYDYDAWDRLLAVTRSTDAVRGNADDVAVAYSYDAAGNIDTITYPDATVVDYDYDAANRLVRVSEGSQITSYAWFADGQLQSATLPNGIAASLQYDASGRLELLTYADADGELVSSFQYAFDANGNRTSVEIRRPDLDTPATGDFLSGLYQYAYDGRNQLTEARYPDGSVVRYTYDGVGNRTSMATDPDGAGPQAATLLLYEYALENRLLRITGAGGNELVRYEYDGSGNQTARITPGGTTTYQYDYRNLLVRVDDGTSVIQYQYDGNGDRIARIENGTATRYVNDPNRPFTQVLAQLDSTGNMTSRFTYGVGRIAGRLPGQGNPVYFLQDGLGSTTDLTSPAGAALASYSYDAFGQPRATVPAGGATPLDNSYLFTGEDLDPDTGLVYLRARYYDPETGRFLSKDPAGFPDGPNQYAYAGSNPVNYVDPSGQVIQIALLGIVGYGVFNGGVSAVQSAWRGDHWTEVLNEAAKGTLQGASGAAAAIGVGLLTKNPWATSAAGSTASELTGEAVDWWQEKGFEPSLVNIGVGTLAGVGASHVSKVIIPSRGGANPNILKWRDPLNPREFGPNTVRDLNRLGVEAFVETVVDALWPAPTQGGVSASIGPYTGAGSTLSVGGGLGIHQASPSPQQTTSPANDRGGVLLDKAVQFVGSLSAITGATIDPATSQVVLLGDQQAGVPELLVDDFVAALRAVFGSTEPPGVSIDQPQSGDPSDPQSVRLFAGLEDTHLGYVFFEADRVMKMLAAGKDNLTGQPVGSSVAGYQSMAERWHASGTSADIRWWFQIGDMKLVRSADGQSFEFDDVGLRLVAENAATGQPATDADALAFADWFTDNYDAIAAEAYPYPSLPGLTQPLVRLKQAAQAVALARFLRDQQIEVDFSWINQYQLPFVDTPETTPTVTVVTTSGAGTSTFYGGIDLAELNQYLADAGGRVRLLADDARLSRPGQTEQAWLLSDNTTDAVALSLTAAPRTGNIAFSDTDLSTPSVAELPLNITRHYNSFQPIDGPLGFGWTLEPSELVFERPAYVRSGDLLNGLREGTVRFLDHASGQALEFESSLVVTFAGDGSISVSGLSEGQPAYAAGELRDGSMLALHGDRGGYTLTRPDGASLVFDADGRLRSQSDRHDNTVTYARTDGRIDTISDGTGIVYTLAYNGDGRVSQVQAATGDRIDYAYDAAGHLLSATRARGGYGFAYEYDLDHRLTATTGPDGLDRLGADSDILNRATARTDARGNTTQWQFQLDPSGQQVSSVEELVSGLTAQTHRDALNRTTLATDALGRTSQFRYDANSGMRNPTAIQLPDPGRPEVHFTYDDAGRLTTVYDPANDPDGNGLTQQFFYDAAGNLTRHVDAREIETLYQYDSHNRLTRTERAGTAWQYAYTPQGLLQAVTDPLGHATTYTYDSFGNVAQVTDAAGGIAAYQYDALHRVTQVTDPAGRALHLQYNDFDQVTRVVAPQGQMTFQYDAVTHRLTRQVDWNGQPTDYTYDPSTGDLLSVSAAGTAVDYQYDRFGNIVSLRDAGGTQTVFDYDELNRPIGVRTGFDDLVASLRDADPPWTVVAGTLVVAGSDATSQGDVILLDNDAGLLTLTVNLQSYPLAGLTFDSIYVDAGAGDDLVDLRSAPAAFTSTLLGGPDDDILLAGAGNDLLLGQAGYDWLEGGPGNDRLRGGQDSDVLLGHTSAVRQLFAGEGVSIDHLAGGGGDDLLFSRAGDMVTAGAGRDTFHGSQPDGGFRHWNSRDIPFGLGGRLVLVGDDAVNQITIKNFGDKLFVTIDDYTRIVDVAAFDYLTGLFQQILVLPAGADDFLDAIESPVPVFFFGAGGNDAAWASDDADQLFGGAGVDDLQGGGGDDVLDTGRGADRVDGGDGDDRIIALDDGQVNQLRGGGGRNFFQPATQDQLPDQRETDIVVAPGIAPPQHIEPPEPNWIGRTTNQAPATPRSRQPARPSVQSGPDANVPQILEFTVNPPSVAHGEGFDVVVRGSQQIAWGSVEIAADANQNGRFDEGIDPILHTHRGRGDNQWRLYLSSRPLEVRRYTLFARLRPFDGPPTPWKSAILDVFENPTPPELPEQISAPPDELVALVPYRNGDASLAGRTLTGTSQIDFYELSPDNSIAGGNFRIWTTGNTDTVVGVYDDQGNRLALDDDNGPGSNGEVLVPLQKDQTYYVAVAGRRGARGDYGLEMTGINQTLTASIATPPGGYSGSAQDTLDQADRLDYFQLNSPAGAKFLDVTLHVAATLGAWVRVEDDQQNIVGATTFTQVGRELRLRSLPVSGETVYYISVFGMYQTHGDYTLEVDFDPNQIGFPDYVPRPAWGQYTPLVVHADGDARLDNQPITGGGQYVYYKLSPETAGNYTVRTTGSLNTQLGLYRDAGPALEGWSDGGGTSQNASLTFAAPGNKDYWVAVSSSTTGTFGLELIGPDQHAVLLEAAGLSYEDQATAWFYNHQPQEHFVVTAPAGAQTLTVTATPINQTGDSHDVNVWLVVENEQGQVTPPANAGGTNGVEQIASYPVVGGQRYWITVHAWQALSTGNAHVHVNFDPNVSGTGELPINTSTREDQDFPDAAINAAGSSVVVWTGHGQSYTFGNWDDEIFFQRFDNQGQPVGVEVKANAPDGDVYQANPAVGMDSSGQFVISWVADGAVYFRRFAANGAAQAAEQNALGKTGLYYQDLAVQDNGAFMIVSTGGETLWGRLFNAAGSPLTATFAIDATADHKEDPSVAADGQGNYVVTWRALSDGYQARDVYVARYNSAGQPLPSGRNTYVPGRIQGVRFDDANQNGRQDAGEPPLGGVTVLLDRNANGAQDSGEPTRVTDDQGRYSFDNVPAGIYRVVQLGAGPSGPAVVSDNFNRPDSTDVGPAWTERLGDMRIENQQVRSSSDGSLMTFNDFQGNDQAVVFDLFYDPGRGHRIVNGAAWLGYADSSNYVKLTMQDNSTSDGQLAYSRTYWEHGASGSSDRWPRFVGADSYITDTTPFSSARVLALYDSASATVTLAFDPGFDGVFDTVLTRGGLPPDGLGLNVGLGGYNHVAIDNFRVDPNFVVVPPVSLTPGEEFEVAPEQSETQYEPAVAAAADGSFVIAYEVSDTDGSESNIYVRRFDNSAQPLGPPVRVNDYLSGTQDRAAVALKDNGEVVVAWQSQGQLGAGREVYFRQLDAAGNLVGLEETLLNDYTTNDQDRPAVAGTGGDRFLFAWESYYQDTNVEGVFGRFLNLPTPVPAPLLLLSAFDPGDGPSSNGLNGSHNGLHIDFGPVTHLGNQATRVLRVTNRGTANLTGGVTLAGDSAERFELLGASTFDLAPAASQDLTLALKTDQRGPFDARLVVTHNAGPDPVEVPISASVVPNPDRYETNDSPKTATDLGTLRDLAAADLSLHHDDDQDWFRFQVPLLATLRIDVAHLHAEGDLDMVLYDDDLEILAASSTISDNESLQATLEPGRTYYLQIYSLQAGANVYHLGAAQVSASVEARRIFYNNSYFDGRSADPNAADDAAIASDKSALLPGGLASFANYTSFSRGINGLMIDVRNLAEPETLGAGSFTFLVGNTQDRSTWSPAPAPSSITVRPGAGQGGSDRVTLLWPDGAIQKQWLQVTVLADDTTGLLRNDLFYFGNAVGEAGNSATNTFVNVFDFAGARDNPHNFLNRAAINDAYDFNRDSLVNVFDLAAVRDNSTNFLTALRLLDLRDEAPGGNRFGAGGEGEGSTSNAAQRLATTGSADGLAPAAADLSNWPALREQMRQSAFQRKVDELLASDEKIDFCRPYSLQRAVADLLDDR